MKIESTLTFKQYLNLIFILTYRRGWMIFLQIIGILMLVDAAVPSLPGFRMQSDAAQYYLLGAGSYLVFLMPISVYIRAKKNYASQQRLREKMIYEFTNDKIIISGESFHTELSWDKTYKVLELNKWILIYQSRLAANILAKEAFGDQLDAFKTLVKSTKIRNNFKK